MESSWACASLGCCCLLTDTYRAIQINHDKKEAERGNIEEVITTEPVGNGLNLDC